MNRVWSKTLAEDCAKHFVLNKIFLILKELEIDIFD